MAATTLLSDNGVTSGITGYTLTGGNDGTLQLQTTTAGGTATTAMTINSSQNVGVGVTPNAWAGGNTALQMAGPSMWGASGVSHWSTNTYFDGTNYKYIASNYVTDYYQLNGTHVWRTAASGTAGANVSALNESMRIDADGKVNIGPAAAATGQGYLAVYTNTAGAPATSGSNDANIATRVRVSSVALDTGTYGSGTTWIQNRSYANYATNYDLALQPNGGNLMIGTSSGNGKVNIYNAANTYVEIASNARTAGTTSMMFGQDVNGTGYVWNRENQTVTFGTNNTTRMTLTAAGNLQFATANAGIIFNKTGALVASTLNDYEEGTWTPATSSSGMTVNAVVGAQYTRVGRLVTAYAYFQFNNTSGGAITAFNVTGLPFQHIALGSYGMVRHYYGGAEASSSAYVETSSTYALINGVTVPTGVTGHMFYFSYYTA